MSEAIPVIVDCDPGHDDAIALLLALGGPELDVLAVTTVHGNQTLEKTTTNALRVLELAGRSDVPVAKGAARPLRRDLVVASHVHGESGLDGPVLPEPRTAPVGQSAVDFMVERIVGSPRPVTLVPTGPLTNVAGLIDRIGGENLEQIVLMGGAIGEGNMTPAAEFNIWADPEAAARVFGSGVDVTMIGLDVTHRALVTPPVVERIRRVGAVGEVVGELVEFYKRYHAETYGWEGPPVHDAVAVARVLRPELVETRRCNVEIELVSELCRGRTVVDRWGRTDRKANADVAVDIDVDSFFDLLVDRIAVFG
jgi:inosine-uridine nucleoside N-ribohydrolase